MSEHLRQALRPGVGGLLTANIAFGIKRLKDGPERASGDRHAVSLVKDDALNVLLIVLKAGAGLHEHRTKGPIAIEVISGSVCFSSGDDQRAVCGGELVALDRGIAHRLEALEESAMILITAIE